MAAKKRQIFECMKGRHVDIDGVPAEQQKIGDILYRGGICRHCKCVYYEPLGEPGLILLPRSN